MADDWGWKKAGGSPWFSTPAVVPRLFQINVENIQTLGRDFKIGKTEEEHGKQTRGTRVLHPGHHLVLGFLFFFFRI